jgi:anti-sigma-K factor RskA
MASSARLPGTRVETVDLMSTANKRTVMRAAEIWNGMPFWRRTSAVFATLSLALLVAAIIARDPPDFSGMPIIAVVRDSAQHPSWAIRLARTAHQIAADSLRIEPPAADHVYQLWLLVPDSAKPHQLGLLPPSGRKRIAVTPENARLLSGAGELIVTLEPAGGSPQPAPSGPTVFRGTLEGGD